MEKRTKAETEKFYRELLAERRRSGLSIRAFARARGIPAGTLSSWAHQLRKRDAARRGKRAAGPTFVPVNVVGGSAVVTAPTSTEAARPARAGGGYEVEFGAGRLLRLPSDFDEARVVALVRAVAAC